MYNFNTSPCDCVKVHVFGWEDPVYYFRVMKGIKGLCLENQRYLGTTSLRYLKDVRCDTAVVKPRIKESLDSSKLTYADGHSSYLVTPCPFCQKSDKASTTLFINKTTGGSVCKPCNLKGELSL